MKRFLTNGRLLFSLLLLAFVLVLFVDSFSYGPKTRLLPSLIGTVTGLFLCLIIATEVFPKLRGKFEVDLFGEASMTSSAATQVSERIIIGKLITVAVWLIVFVTLVLLVGFLVAIPICYLAFLKIYSNKRWATALVGALLMGGFIFLVFKVAMKVGLFGGILLGFRLL